MIINLCFLAKIRSGTNEPLFKWLITLFDEISKKSRFNWELVAVPTFQLGLSIAFSGSGKFPIHSNISPHSPPISAFWDNGGKIDSTINTSTEAIFQCDVKCHLQTGQIITTSVPSPSPLLLSAETRLRGNLRIQIFMIRWLSCVTFKVVALDFKTYRSVKNICTSYWATDAVTAARPSITQDQWAGFKWH